MNGVGLTTVGCLLGHRKCATTAIYAHFDDATLQGAATQAAAVIARAMGFRAETPPELSDPPVPSELAPSHGRLGTDGERGQAEEICPHQLFD
ncbi:MAG: hypothetical protein OXK20_02860 [Deltaproteobacteria bacterium]|nr:hypothetical protein [Deltaproteobacteria bacterium]MDE0354584.1 hypothetical protein [Deltaproteobacteria bacterium]